MRGGGKDASYEVARIEATKITDYITLVQNMALRLEIIEGCTSIDYTPPASQPETGNFSCYMYHPDGGSVPYQNFDVDECLLQGSETSMTQLSVGASCGNIIYAGTQGGSRLYAYKTDIGSYIWSSPTQTTTNSGNSNDDGMTNTNIILAMGSGSYPAASACRTLGENWYLPSDNELSKVVYSNYNVGDFTGTITSGSDYWSSTHATAFATNDRAKIRRGGLANTGTNTKNSSLLVRCVRRD